MLTNKIGLDIVHPHFKEAKTKFMNFKKYTNVSTHTHTLTHTHTHQQLFEEMPTSFRKNIPAPISHVTQKYFTKSENTWGDQSLYNTDNMGNDRQVIC